jgi:hypothetical protein
MTEKDVVILVLAWMLFAVLIQGCKDDDGDDD